jgi:hypothetical protein
MQTSYNWVQAILAQKNWVFLKARHFLNSDAQSKFARNADKINL